MESVLKISLLGNFQIEYQGNPVAAFGADRIQSLLTYLLLHRQAPQPRHHLAFQLWPDSSDSQARTNLRNLLFTLRNALPDAERFLEITNVTLWWKPNGPYALDVADFQRALDEAAADPANAQEKLARAVSLYKGDLLPGNYDDWIISPREELHHCYVEALERLISLLEQAGDLREAIRCTQRLIGDDPLNENSYITLMRLHAMSGDRAGVRRVYEQCASTLRRELNTEPAPSTQAAYEHLLRVEVAYTPPAAVTLVAPAAVPVRRLSPPKSTVAFVGRERELAELAELLADPGCRLLTITAPGGMGKTQLALQTAHGHAPIYADGAAFVTLVAVESVDLIPSSIASGLGVTFSGATDPVEQLLNVLQPKELLLVLDNFEHLVEGADLLSEILMAAPNVKILATSRERLNLQEEWVYDLHGLSIPDDDAADWQESSAVQLFVQSARRAAAAFAITETDRSAVIRICRLVEAMPLALQLAAAWVRVLSVEGIVAEIERSIAFLESTHRNVSERHRSLRAVFDQSWSLLTDQEQQVMCRLSVFRGGFDRSFAESVTGASLPLLSSLVDKSLVRRTEAGRYSLHELIRQYGHTALQAAGELESTRDRHLRAYVEMAADMEDRMFGSMQVPLIERLETEHDNLRAALDWGLQPGTGMIAAEHPHERVVEGARLAAVLGRFWYLRGHLAEGRSWLETALARLEVIALDPSPAIQKVQSRLLFGAGEVIASADHPQKAQPLLEKSLVLARQLNDRRGIIMAQHRLSETILEQGDYATTVQLAEETLTLARELEDPWLMGRSLSILATVALEQEEYARSEMLANEALKHFRSQKEGGMVVYLLNILGQLALYRGDPAHGTTLLEEALTLNRTVTRLRMGAAWTLRNLGTATQLQGDLKRAADCFRESVELRWELGQIAGLAWAMEGLAEVAAATGAPERAAILWGAAESMRSDVGSLMSKPDRNRHEASVATARDLLGRERFQAAWIHGKSLSQAEVVAYALEKFEGGRWQVAGGRWQAAGSRRQAAGSRQQVAGGRWQVVGGRW
jgi:predicted ATPase/DNA-binding SARP family transcriptional activator